MPVPAATSWAELLPAALAGTRRQPFASLPGLTPALGSEADATEKQLLLTAANLALVQRATRSYSGPARVLPALPPETQAAVPRAATRALEAMLSEGSEGSEGGYPVGAMVEATLSDLRQWGYRLPFRVAWQVLHCGCGFHTDARTARLALGERCRWLNALAGENTYWHLHALGHDWATLHAPQRREYLARRMQARMEPDDSYLPQLAQLPAGQRTELLWETWRANSGYNLPAPLQAELDALLAATPLAERPWTTNLEQLRYVAGHLRQAGHPLLAQVAGWAAPLLVLEQPAGRPARVRIELPAARDRAWQAAGLPDRSIFFWRNGDLEACLQELLLALGPRYWLSHWQLTPAELVALVAAAPQGRLMLEAWSQALSLTVYNQPEPELVRALLALPRRLLSRELQARLLDHLPLPERVAWATALLPANGAAPHEADWAKLLQDQYLLLRQAPDFVRQLLPVLAAALAAPRPVAGLGDLLSRLHMVGLDAQLYPAAQATLGAVAPRHPAVARQLRRLLQGLALRYQLRQGCEAAAGQLPTS